jgi:ribosomal protein S18 acetylase RimI-like enzyme
MRTSNLRPSGREGDTGAIVIRILGRTEADVLSSIADGVFDDPIDPAWCAEFFGDPRHHLAVALDGTLVIGMASGVHYLHPDKPHELFVNEVGVAAPYRNQGVGRGLVRTLLRHGTSLGCESAWVLTESSNAAARRMYAAAGGLEQHAPPIMIEFKT